MFIYLNRSSHHVGHVGRRRTPKSGVNFTSRVPSLACFVAMLRDDAVGGLGTVDRGQVSSSTEIVSMSPGFSSSEYSHARRPAPWAGTVPHRADAAYADRRAVAAGLRRSLVDVDAWACAVAEVWRCLRAGSRSPQTAAPLAAGQVDLLLDAHPLPPRRRGAGYFFSTTGQVPTSTCAAS